jgi:hypothetical protein
LRHGHHRHTLDDENTELPKLKNNLGAVERETGIEPVSLAWKAKVLPLNYSRPANSRHRLQALPRLHGKKSLVEEAGFEPA